MWWAVWLSPAIKHSRTAEIADCFDGVRQAVPVTELIWKPNQMLDVPIMVFFQEIGHPIASRNSIAGYAVSCK